MFFKSSFNRSLKYGAILNWIAYSILVSLSNLWIWKHHIKSFSFVADWKDQFASTYFETCKIYALIIFSASENWILLSNSTTLPLPFWNVNWLQSSSVLLIWVLVFSCYLTKLPAVNYHHKEFHLGCCSSPRSASAYNMLKTGRSYISEAINDLFPIGICLPFWHEFWYLLIKFSIY